MATIRSHVIGDAGLGRLDRGVEHLGQRQPAPSSMGGAETGDGAWYGHRGRPPLIARGDPCAASRSCLRLVQVELEHVGSRGGGGADLMIDRDELVGVGEEERHVPVSTDPAAGRFDDETGERCRGNEGVDCIPALLA